MTSTYNGRQSPNVSQCLRDLNSVSPQDTTAFTVEDGFETEGDLAIFTNTRFFDFDSGQNTDFQARAVAVVENATRQNPTSIDVTSNLDFVSGNFNFTDFNAYTPFSTNELPGAAQVFQPLQPSHTPVQIPNQQPQLRQRNARTGQMRKPEAMSAVPPPTPGGQPMNFEEASRVAAEEDKRRRNTAASARFRIKKKRREQDLEKSAQLMIEQATDLESKVTQLETENKWLKNLLVEKNEGSGHITASWKEFTRYASKKMDTGKVTGIESSTPESVEDNW